MGYPKPETHPIRRVAARPAAALLAAVLTLALTAAWTVPALADVRKADLVMGETVEARGLTVAQCPSVAAEYVYVVDEDGQVYFDRNAEVETQIASITKIMTAIVALEQGSLDDVITVSQTAAKIGESSAELQAGDKLTLAEALKALMIPSGNDAAQAIAEFYGGRMLDSNGGDATNEYACNQAFVDAMNAKAQELGMTSSEFSNAHGLDFDEYTGSLHSTAKDVATMVAAAMQNDTFREVVSMGETTIKITRDGSPAGIRLEPTDELLGNYEGLCGVKTGYTEKAGNCFAAACNRGDRDVYCIVLKSTDEWQRFTDTSTLLDWVYGHTVNYALANSPETMQVNQNGQTLEVPVMARVGYPGWTDATFAVGLSNSSATVPLFDLNGNVSQEIQMKDLSGDIRVGDVVGKLVFSQHNQVVAEADLVALEEQRGPNPFEAIGVFFDRLLFGKTQAPDTLINQTPLLNDKTTASSL
ncbi:MAG: D-alanyl-D-alanine carboxypeptidase family protein [Coriobacteriia bacterium]|nr:D-alanyl-D-alanine carboxypeptidase family protein [Coriobacteriia bacterium]